MTFAFLGRGAGAARDRQRAAYFDLCRPGLHPTRKGATPCGFARLAGRHRGRSFDLQALPDALSYRKLPCLWLMVTLTEPMPVKATLDFMVRPNGAEVFSNFAALAHQLALPAGFPAATLLRTDAPDRLPPIDILDACAGLLAAERAKELVISPKGLRLVWLAEEADRSRYLWFRDSELGRRPLAPEVLGPLMDGLVGLADKLRMPATAAEGVA